MVTDIAEADDINRAILHIFHQHRDKLILPKVDHDTEGAVKFGAHYGLLMTSKTATQRWLAERPYDSTLPVYNTEGVVHTVERIKTLLNKAGLTRREQHDAVHQVLLTYSDLG